MAEILYITAGVGFLFPLLKQYKSYILLFFFFNGNFLTEFFFSPSLFSLLVIGVEKRGDLLTVCIRLGFPGGTSW